MVGPLNLLIMLPTIMMACGISSIVCSVVILLILAICMKEEKQKITAEKEAQDSIVKFYIPESQRSLLHAQ